jgi:LysM repeat protein
VKTAYSKTGQASGGKKGSKAGKASVVRVHEVKRGDSLSKLASRYGVTVAALKKRNKLSSSMIVVGKRLTID